MKEYLIKINQLKIRANLGVTEKEKSRKQPIIIDIELMPEYGIESIEDHIERTINYSEIRNLIKNYFKNNKPNLIESASYEIANLIQARFKCRTVIVRISKFPYRDTGAVTTEVRVEKQGEKSR